MNPPISSMMQRPVYSVTMEDSVAQVESMLSGRHLSWVPVLEPARGEVAPSACHRHRLPHRVAADG